MAELVTAFTLGNAAILGNVCMLPLYPGLFALLAAKSESEPQAVRWMGVLVLAGVLVTMVVLAGILSALNAVFAQVVVWILPVAYVAVLLLGVAMLAGRNPLQSFGRTDSPTARSAAGSAFLYGVALAPMTLPCTGPVILSAFTLGAVTGTQGFLDQLAFFLAFGLGFGWPLVLLPLVTSSRQAAFRGFITRNHAVITRVSGALLVGVALVGLWAEYT